jgi:DNA transformation protein
VVFALLAANALYLKVDDATRSRFEALGLGAFQPFPDKPGTMQYSQPPAEFFEDSAVMREWCREAMGAGRRAEARKKPKAARKRK